MTTATGVAAARAAANAEANAEATTSTDVMITVAWWTTIKSCARVFAPFWSRVPVSS